MNEKYLKVIEALGDNLIKKDLDIDLLKYENEKLKAKLEQIEQYIDCYCEELNK